MNKVSVRWVSKMLTPELRTSRRTSRTIPMWLSKIYFTMRYSGWNVGSTTLILSQNNKVCNGTNESVIIVILLHCLTVFSHVISKQPTTTKMHKIFIAQKSYCACRVLSVATIRSKYYFNFILNRTRSGQELFDCPSYIWHCNITACFYDYFRWSKKLHF